MDILTPFMILVPIVIGLVEVVKRVGLPDRFAPLAAVALGVAGTYFTGGIDVIEGITAGLAAAGLYSGTRATLNV